MGVVLAAEIDASSDALGIADSQLVWETPAQQAQALDATQALGGNTGVLASRYAGKISAYEVWNEPNVALFYGKCPKLPQKRA